MARDRLVMKPELTSVEDKRPRWLGEAPSKCDICSTPLAGKSFVDGKTIYGPWANMCLDCHVLRGVGLGTGRGQKYGADLYKIEG